MHAREYSCWKAIRPSVDGFTDYLSHSDTAVSITRAALSNV